MVPRPGELCLEVMLKLEHVAEVLCPWETEAAINLRRHGIVMNLFVQRIGECGRHLRPVRCSPEMPTLPAGIFVLALQDAKSTLSNVFRSECGKVLFTHWKRYGQLPIPTLA